MSLSRSKKPMRRQSARTRAKAPTRRQIVEDMRAIGICELRNYGRPCSGGLQVHEVVRRSQARDAEIDRSLTSLLCATHHEMDTNLETAQRLGLRVPGWAWRQYGQRAIREAKQIRMGIFMGGAPRNPFWVDAQP